MKKKTVRLWSAVAAVAAAIIWILLPLVWKPLCEIIREAGFPLATYGKAFTALSLATGLHMIKLQMHTLTTVQVAIIAAANGIMLGIALYSLAVCSKKWKAAVIGWGLCCVIAAALCKCFLDFAANVSMVRCIFAAFPFFYYPVAGIAAAVAVGKRWNLALGSALIVFWIWCFINARMFPLVSDTGWALLNTPAQTIAGISGAYNIMPQAVCRTLVIGLNGIFYSLGVFVFLKMSIRNKLITGGLFMMISCMTGLLISPPYMVAAAALMLLGIALSGCFVLGHHEYDIDDDEETPSPTSVTYVNMVMEQEKMALNADKTTFFHLDEPESWEKHDVQKNVAAVEEDKTPEATDSDNASKSDKPE